MRVITKFRLRSRLKECDNLGNPAAHKWIDPGSDYPGDNRSHNRTHHPGNHADNYSNHGTDRVPNTGRKRGYSDSLVGNTIHESFQVPLGKLLFFISINSLEKQHLTGGKYAKFL